MILGGDVLAASDEEEAIEDVKVFAARHGDLKPEVVNTAGDHLLTTARAFYGILALAPLAEPLAVPAPSVVVDPVLEEREEVPAVGCIIALSQKGAILRLHRADGCWKAQHLSFASYQLFDVDPVPQALYTHYCRSCWPRSSPAVKAPDEVPDSCTESSSSTESAASAA